MSSLLTALLLIRDITGFESRSGHRVPGVIIFVIMLSSPKEISGEPNNLSYVRNTSGNTYYPLNLIIIAFDPVLFIKVGTLLMNHCVLFVPSPTVLGWRELKGALPCLCFCVEYSCYSSGTASISTRLRT
jgi:hypothetical protein